MFDLEKFKTGKYYVHLPTQELYDEVMEFLKGNGIGWLSRTKEFLYKSEMCIRYTNETDYGFVGRKGIVHSSENYYIAKGFEELPTNFKKSYSINIGGDDYTDKLSYGDTISTNETKPNDLVKSPNKPNNKEHHQKLIDQIHETYVDKNKKYGDAFNDTINKYGYISALTRMHDKFSRIESFIINGYEDSEESLIDSLLDLSNYCLMTVMELEKEGKK